MAGAELEVGPDHPDFPMRLDVQGQPQIITAWGKKGSGKSVFNRQWYASWPGDKLCIDVNGNAAPGADAERLTGDLPKRWPDGVQPLGERRKPRNLHYRAHPMSDTYRDDLDRALGLALFPQDHRVCVWAGEVGELQPNGRPGPRMMTLLMQNRHYNVTALFDGPRPVFVHPLTLAQSNLVAVYRLPNPNDRKRIADAVGIPPKDFDKECFETWRRGPHWFVLVDTERDELWRCPPLPVGDEAAA